MTIPTITDDLIAEIEAAAKAATPGQWDWGGTPVSKPEEALEICRASIDLTKNPGPYFCEVYTQDGKRTAIVGHGPTGQQNARHIAAANPANVLALIASLREIERDAARYRWLREYENDCFMLNTLQVASMEDLDVAIDAAMKGDL